MNGFLDDFKNTWNKPNNSLAKLIIINVAVWVIFNLIYFAARISKNAAIYDVTFDILAIPPVIMEYIYRPWTLFTYFFTHQDFFHILFNMLIMYWFGQLIQEYLGAKKLVAIYIWGGIAGGLAYLLIFNTVPFFIGNGGPGMIGASAGVYAIVTAAATLMPDFRMFLLLFGPVKIKYIAAVYIFLSFVATVGSNAGGNIAHLGGALIGFLFIVQMRKGSDWTSPIYVVLDFFGNLFSSKKLTVSHRRKETVAQKQRGRGTNLAGRTGAPNQADIDAILDKIAESGYEKLSAEEKQILFKASQRKD